MTYTMPTGNDFGNLFLSMNTSLNYVPAAALLTVVFFISFRILQVRGTMQALTGSSFMTMLTSFILGGMGAIPADWVYVPLILFVSVVAASFIARPSYS